MFSGKIFLLVAVVLLQFFSYNAVARVLDKRCKASGKPSQFRGGALLKQSGPYGFEIVAAATAAVTSQNVSVNSTNSIFSKYDKDGKKVLTYYGLMLAGTIIAHNAHFYKFELCVAKDGCIFVILKY
jgi:hypothetical protein